MDDFEYIDVPDEVEEEATDWGKAVKAPPRKPADDLPERKTMMRRATGFIPDYEIPTIADLEKHAERFGAEFVVESAIELGYGLETVIRLQDACDRITVEQIKRDHPHRRVERFKPAEDRVRRLMGLPTAKEEAEAEELLAA